MSGISYLKLLHITISHNSLAKYKKRNQQTKYRKNTQVLGIVSIIHSNFLCNLILLSGMNLNNEIFA